MFVCRHSRDIPDEGGGAVHRPHGVAAAGQRVAGRGPGPGVAVGPRYAAHHVPGAAAHRARRAGRAQGDREDDRSDNYLSLTITSPFFTLLKFYETGIFPKVRAYFCYKHPLTLSAKV